MDCNLNYASAIKHIKYIDTFKPLKIMIKINV